MRKLNLLILVLISSFTAMRAVTSEKDLWQLHTSDIHADYVGAPIANGGIGDRKSTRLNSSHPK